MTEHFHTRRQGRGEQCGTMGMGGCRRAGRRQEQGQSCGRRNGGGLGVGRLLNHGGLRLLALKLIAAKPRHGYELIKEIEELSGGSYTPSPGVIYPTLTLLEELGHVVITVENNKKLHSLTPDGQDYLAQHRTEVGEIEAKLDQARQASAHSPAPSIIRAMENVRLALHLRLAQGPMEQDMVQKVAAALDNVVVLIERD